MGSKRLSPHITRIEEEDMPFRALSSTSMAPGDSAAIRHHRTSSKRAGLLERYAMGSTFDKRQ